MLAKVPKTRNDRKSSFGSLVRYVTRADDERERAGVEVFTNCMSLETAAVEMYAVAGRSARVHDPAYHVVVSWREGEQSTKEQAFEAARAAIEALGMNPDGHQHVFAIHRDTDNTRLHVAVNRVSMETGRAVHPGMSYLKLDRCMRELELRQGWQHDNGPFVVVERNGQPVIESDRTQRTERAKPAKARDMEAFANVESLTTYASGPPKVDVLAALRRASATWQDVHEAFARHGLEVRIKGQGLAIHAKGHDDLTPVKASSIHEQFGRGKLEKRLGPWVEPIRAIRIATAGRTYLAREINDMDEMPQRAESGARPRTGQNRNEDTRALQREHRARMRADLRSRYDAYCDQHRREQDGMRGQLRARHQQEYRTLLDRHRRVRDQIRASGMQFVGRKALYSIEAFERARELEDQRNRQRAERAALQKIHPYRQWVERQAQDGDGAAIAQLRGWAYAERRMKKRNTTADTRNRVEANAPRDMDPFPPKTAQAMQDWTWRVDTGNGDVEYMQHGEHRFTDEGRLIVFEPDAVDHDALAVGLRLAREKFGRDIRLSGSDQFRERAITVIVAERLDIRLEPPELEARRQALEAERQQQIAARTHAAQVAKHATQPAREVSQRPARKWDVPER